MKVMCIDSTTEPGWLPVELKEGEIYTVIDSMNDNDGSWYMLLEGDPGAWYEAKYLIPISDISETEMERNYNFKTEPV